jgi:CRISPR-associated protein Cmr2
MIYDLYAELAGQSRCPAPGKLPGELASGFVDGCTTWFAVNEIRAAQCKAKLGHEQDRNKKQAIEKEKREHERAKNDARRCYMERAQNVKLQQPGDHDLDGGTKDDDEDDEDVKLQLPGDLDLDPWPPECLHADWFALEVAFELMSPWYSKDDRLFHVLDNPVRKDRVFGVPFMAAASWKGMLRWACRMQAGLREHFEQGQSFKDWSDPVWILHLFGNEKGATDHFQQGALAFYPTWFDKIGFEVINPHDRPRRAGTQPIYYEVVPGRRPKQNNPNGYEEGGKGTLRLLYAPWPGMRGMTAPAEWLTHCGISAKRTVGWGTAEITKWRAWRGNQPIAANSRKDLRKQLLPNSGGAS